MKTGEQEENKKTKNNMENKGNAKNSKYIQPLNNQYFFVHRFDEANYHVLWVYFVYATKNNQELNRFK